ncbi:MAG: diguanylate cyclase [Clostridia bacterium]|nr:diguanylate cyclase [Clostridia bacterium]
MHSIRMKMASITIAAILTSILALGAIGIFAIGAESDRSSVEKMNLISENTQRKLGAYLDSIQQSVSMAIRMAHDSLDDPDIEYLGHSGTPEEVERLDAAMQRHCDEVEHAFSSIATSTNGIVTYYYCINDDYGSNEHGFFWSRMGEEGFVKQPDLISSDLDRSDTEHTTWYYSPLRAAAPVWVGPYKAHYLGEVWTLSYVAPIFHQGFVVGVLGMDILFDTIVEQADAVQVYNSGFAFLMDRDGFVLYHPDTEVTMDQELFSQELSRDILRRRSTGDMLVRYSRNSEPWQLAFSAINDDFKVAVTAPVSEITAYQRRMMLVILMVAIVILAVFTLVTLLLMNRLTKPLMRLTAASRKLIAGDYEVELDYEGKDEIGMLTRAFRQMRDHMKLYIHDLNHRAYSDALTGVKNKGAFDSFSERLNQVIAAGGEQPPEFAVTMFDCNRLKQVNDDFGHERGDQYLKTACAVICAVFAHSPVFRLGGDEFAVLLQQSDYQRREQLMSAFDRMAGDVNAAAQHPWERVDISKGMAVYRPGQDENVEQVLSRADEIMYAQKRAARDQ